MIPVLLAAALSVLPIVTLTGTLVWMARH